MASLDAAPAVGLRRQTYSRASVAATGAGLPDRALRGCPCRYCGGRHEPHEIDYSGSTEEIRRYCLFGVQASGDADRMKGFAEQCLAEYDLDGW